MENAIEIKNLTKDFKNNRALGNVELRFEQGHIYGLLGRNGAGKTTLLNLISNRLFPSEGAVFVDGMPAMENDKAQSLVYFMGEKLLMPDDTKVKDLFKTTAAFYGFDEHYANMLAQKFGLDTRKKLKSLSTGYATIAKLIAALATDAPYLLLDEPVLGLDANHRELFYRELLESYAEKPRTVVISTHLIEEVSPIIEHVVIIKRGEILLNAPTEQVKAMGYTVSGKAADVDAYCARHEADVLGVDTLGGLKTASLMGESGDVPPQLERSPMELQKLFVHLTNE